MNTLELLRWADQLTEQGVFKTQAERTVFKHYLQYLWITGPNQGHVLSGCVPPAVVAKKTGLDERSVRRANKKLIEIGLVEITYGAGRHGGVPGPVDVYISTDMVSVGQLGSDVPTDMVSYASDMVSVENVPTDMVSVPNGHGVRGKEIYRREDISKEITKEAAGSPCEPEPIIVTGLSFLDERSESAFPGYARASEASEADRHQPTDMMSVEPPRTRFFQNTLTGRARAQSRMPRIKPNEIEITRDEFERITGVAEWK